MENDVMKRDDAYIDDELKPMKKYLHLFVSINQE